MSEDEATKLVQDAAEPFAGCVTDKIYDKAQPRTLSWLAKGEDKQDSGDLELVQNAFGECALQVLSEGAQ